MLWLVLVWGSETYPQTAYTLKEDTETGGEELEQSSKEWRWPRKSQEGHSYLPEEISWQSHQGSSNQKNQAKDSSGRQVGEIWQ